MPNDTSARTEVDHVRRVALHWIDAVASADLPALSRLMTEDIIVIHGNGRKVEGRDAVLADFAQAFRTLTIKQTVEFEETVVCVDWAFDRATVHTTIRRWGGGEPQHFQSRTITILRREAPQTWCVARSIGVVIQGQSST